MSKSILVTKTTKSCRECELAIKHYFGRHLFIRCPKGIIGPNLGDSEKVYDTVHPQCPLQDTTELLEGYKLERKEVYSNNGLEIRCSVVIDNIHHRVTEETYNILDKLHKALGGE